MVTNYTPLNTTDLDKKYKHEKTSFGLETILLLIGTFTALVLAFLLFVLIQKKMQTTAPVVPTPAAVRPSPTPIATPTQSASAAATIIPKAQPDITATGSANPSPQLSPSVSPATGSAAIVSPTASPSAAVRMP